MTQYPTGPKWTYNLSPWHRQFNVVGWQSQQMWTFCHTPTQFDRQMLQIVAAQFREVDRALLELAAFETPTLSVGIPYNKTMIKILW